MYWLVRPGPARLEQILAAQRDQALTYAEVGATREDELPAGYHHLRHSVELGRGQGVLERGAEALRRWQAHAGAGLHVVPPDAPVEAGTEVLVCFRLARLHVVAACRIVYVVDEPARFGFAYGTLPAHPEEGEEAFVVEKTGDTVHFRVTAFSRHRQRLLTLADPLTRRVQLRVMSQYVEGVRRFVNR